MASLEAFLAGYETGLLNHRILERETPPFSGFGAFVSARVGRAGERATAELPGGALDLGSIGWATAIREAAPNDREALVLFFKLLREYRAQANRCEAT